MHIYKNIFEYFHICLNSHALLLSLSLSLSLFLFYMLTAYSLPCFILITISKLFCINLNYFFAIYSWHDPYVYLITCKRPLFCNWKFQENMYIDTLISTGIIVNSQMLLTTHVNSHLFHSLALPLVIIS